MNVEAAVIGYLSSKGVDAYADVPTGNKTSFVTVERTGSTTHHPAVDTVTLAIQCWAKTRAQAVSLVETVDGHMQSISATGVSSSSRMSYYNFPDPDHPLARYQLVYEVTTHK